MVAMARKSFQKIFRMGRRQTSSKGGVQINGKVSDSQSWKRKRNMAFTAFKNANFVVVDTYRS
jgi:hypothetical protein